MAEKALADITSEQTTTAGTDLLFVEKAGVAAKISWANLADLANLGLNAAARELLNSANVAAMRDVLNLGSTATRDVDNTEDLDVNATAVLSRGGVKTAIENYTPLEVKAWVSFNGTGAVAIRGSSNVSSITDNGVGQYTVNFTAAMADTNYAVVASGCRGTGSIGPDAGIVGYSTPLTTSVKVGSGTGSGSYEDKTFISIAVLGG